MDDRKKKLKKKFDDTYRAYNQHPSSARMMAYRFALAANIRSLQAERRNLITTHERMLKHYDSHIRSLENALMRAKWPGDAPRR